MIMNAPHEALNEEHVAQLLAEAVESDDVEFSDYHPSTRSFVADSMLTRQAGFTIKLADGSEFQVTVIQSRGTNPDYLPEDGTLDDEDALWEADGNERRLGMLIQELVIDASDIEQRRYSHLSEEAELAANRGGPGPDDEVSDDFIGPQTEEEAHAEWVAEMEYVDRTAFGHDGYSRSQCPRCGSKIDLVPSSGMCDACTDAAYDRYAS
jgi:hypothetical protein